MKRILIFILCSIFILSGCSSSEIDSLRLKVNRENKQIERIEKEFTLNKESVDFFNTTLLNILKQDSYNIDDFDVIQNYVKSGRSLYDTFNVLNINSQDSVNIYPLLIDESGDILDLIVIYKESKIYSILLTWQDGEIINIDLKE